MKKELFDEICKFCEYLNDWETKKDFYVKELLPDLVYGRRYGLDKKALQIFNNIYDLTPGPELKNLVFNITEIREDKDKFIYNQIKTAYTRFFEWLNDKYKFQGFIHSTSFENFKNIMKDGYIYSRNYLEQNNIQSSDIALNDVIEKTEDNVKNYVRCYWRVKTPTNYDNEGIKPQKALTEQYKAHSPNPVIIILNKDLVLDKNVQFSPINAGSKYSKLYETINDKFIWSDIFHDSAIYDFEDKRSIILRKHAEFLYPNKIITKKIQKIIFRNQADYDRAILEFGNDTRFCIDDSQFCNNWLYVKDYNINYSESNIKMEISYNFGKEYYKQSCDLSDYTHTISLLDLNQKIIISYKVNSSIHNHYNLPQTFNINNDKSGKYICYYIDDIECIRTKIND